jgi:Peptidase A4 family
MRRSWRTLVMVFALASGLAVAAASPPASAAFVPANPGGLVRHLTVPRPIPGSAPGSVTSTNWAGYAATGGNGAFTSVASDWTQPSVTCKSGDQYTSFWAGLDGYSDASVEQIGTDADCAGKTAGYYAWYEMYPAAPVDFSNTVEPGDHFAVSVSYTGTNEYALKISDTTQGWSHTVDKSLAGADRSSAEIIVEAPCCGSGGDPLPLAHFGSITFTSAMVNGSGLCDSDPVKITSPGLTVSPITGCTNFTVTQSATTGRPRGGLSPAAAGLAGRHGRTAPRTTT